MDPRTFFPLTFNQLGRRRSPGRYPAQRTPLDRELDEEAWVRRKRQGRPYAHAFDPKTLGERLLQIIKETA
jgi:hypothetical protein